MIFLLPLLPGITNMPKVFPNIYAQERCNLCMYSLIFKNSIIPPTFDGPPAWCLLLVLLTVQVKSRLAEVAYA